MNGHAIWRGVERPLVHALRAISLTTMTLFLAGCGSLFAGRTEAPITYVLRPSFAAIVPASSPAIPPGAGEIILQVGRVVAAPGYATDSILATLPDRRLDVFAASRWPEELPRVVETLAVQALRAAGFAAHEAAAPVAATHLLAVTISRFDAEYRDPAVAPVVRVGLEVTVLRRADRHVLGVFAVDAEATAEANRMGSIIAAFEAASRQAFITLTAQLGTLATGNVIGATSGRHSPATITP